MDLSIHHGNDTLFGEGFAVCSRYGYKEPEPEPEPEPEEPKGESEYDADVDTAQEE
jgi:hypothetical protein